MMQKLFFLYTTLLLPMSIYAQSLSLSASRHIEQESSIGFSASYKYTLSENLEFESTYLQTQDLSYDKVDITYLGKYNSVLAGINARSSINKQLDVKLGSGASYIFNSNNELMVEDEQVAPYLKLTVNYKLTPSFSAELGQLSIFHEGELDASHSIFFGVNWTFGSKAKSIKSSSHSQKQPVPIIEKSKHRSPQVTPTVKKVLSDSTDKPIVQLPWHVQLGAYSKYIYASDEKIKVEKNLPQHNWRITYHNKLYRIVSDGYSNKSEAVNISKELKKSQNIDGYVIFISAN